MAEKKKGFLENLKDGFDIERNGDVIGSYQPENKNDDEDEQQNQDSENQEMEDDLGGNERDAEEGDVDQEDKEIDDESEDDADSGEEGESSEDSQEDEEESGEWEEKNQDDNDSNDENADDEENQDDQEGSLNVYEYTEGVFETEDALKQHLALLKEHPELLDMENYFMKEGNLQPWLEATQVDVDKFSDIDVLKASHQSKYEGKNLDQSDIDFLFEEDVLSRFAVKEEDFEDDPEGLARRQRAMKLKMKAEADDIRTELKKELAERKLPTREVNADQAEKQAKADQALRNKLAFAIRKEIKDGKLAVRVSEKQSVMLKVSPKKISDLLANSKDPSIYLDAKGNFDLRKMAMSVDPDGFIANLIGDSETNGKEKFVRRELKNRKDKNRTPEGEGRPRKEVLPPNLPSSWKGATIIRG